MKKRILICIPMMILAFAAWPAHDGRAQETAKPAAEAKATLAEAQKLAAHPVYHLVFVVRELDGDKTINSRTYSLSVKDGDWGKIRTGNRVPVQYSEGNVSYQDVGTDIDCLAQEQQAGVLLNAKFRISGFTSPEEIPGRSLRPVFRNLSLEEQPEVTLGKATIIGKVEDVATNHHFEFEVTATKVK